MSLRMTSRWVLVLSVILAMSTLAPAAGADPEGLLERGDPHAALDGSEPAASVSSTHSSTTNMVVSSESSSKRFRLRGRGERIDQDATTDVWVLGDFAYTGTFNSPCGGTSPDAGVWVWDVDHTNRPEKVGVILSPVGSRSNDVKVASMSSGDILVHSNESCGGGPGGFEIYDVDDPESPVPLASVRIDELNPISDFIFGGITDVGVHNLFLFTEGGEDDDDDDDDDDGHGHGGNDNDNGGRDYVAVVAETAFDNHMIFEITDPTNPTLVSAWGAEEVFDPGVGDLTDPDDPVQFDRVLDAALWLLDGFGNSQNRFLHDTTISADGTRAYLSNWDAGLILLDISDPADPQVVSVALDPVNGSLDDEVNSHAAWPSEDGSVVVETEEDFSAWETSAPPGGLTLDGTDTPGDPTIPATAISTNDGDSFELATNQTSNAGSTDGTSVVVTSGPLMGSTFAAIELATAAGSPTFATTGTISGDIVWIGRACTATGGDALANSVGAGDIAIARRGFCEFEEKANAAAAAGAATVVIANNVSTATPWGGVRIWDYADPANPVLASTFFTTCSASTAPAGPCDPAGTYSVHNVIVEEGKAYISWYWDGMLVLDISDPYNPVEIARFLDPSTNGGFPNDFWGVYKVPDDKHVFGSDRSGGLYVFRDKTKKVDDDD